MVEVVVVPVSADGAGLTVRLSATVAVASVLLPRELASPAITYVEA